jgi:hypothetical protein
MIELAVVSFIAAAVLVPLDAAARAAIPERRPLIVIGYQVVCCCCTEPDDRGGPA